VIRKRLVVRRRLDLPEDKYGIAMIGLTATFIMLGLVPQGRVLRLVVALVLTATLYFTIQTSGAKRLYLRIVSVAIVIAWITVLIEVIVTPDRRPIVSYTIIGLLSLAAPVFVLQRLLGHAIVTMQTLVGAVVVYVLLGLSFTFLLSAGELLQGQRFLVRDVHSSTDFLYLSFITLTTVGYGDVTPGTNLAREVVIVEAVLAQLFLATVIARFASLFTGRGQIKTQEELEVEEVVETDESGNPADS